MRIALIISGSVACYKSLELIRKFKKDNHEVNCILTSSAEKFITPLMVSSLSGNKTHTELFTLSEATEMNHINLSRDNDIILVAPATANIIGKYANAMADDLASNVLLAANKPVYIAPAMNVEMWNNPINQDNIKRLKDIGVKFINPVNGLLACGEEGAGKFEDIENIANFIYSDYLKDLPLKGKKAIVTSGATIEEIDPVRYISNYSSGKQGHAIASSLANAGAEVTLVTGNADIEAADNIHNVIKIKSAEEMLKACQESLPADIAIFAAAVCDWKIENHSNNKIKKNNSKLPPKLSLIENPDILKTISNCSNRPNIVIGFAAETENLQEAAKEKLLRKGCDIIVANDVSQEYSTFGSNTNKVYILDENNTHELPILTKSQVANEIVDRICNTL